MDQTQIATLARELMNEHGLHNWAFKFDNARTRAGSCRFSYKGNVITLSKPLMVTWADAEVRNVILHEVAHALAGPHENHGYKWRSIAQSIGCTGDRCWTPSADAPAAPAPWIGTCPNGHTSGKYRKPTAVRSCGKCSRSFNRAYLITWERAA